MKNWKIVISEFLKITLIFVVIVWFWLCAGVLFMHSAYADEGRSIEPNVMTCQNPDSSLFFVFLNDNIVVSKHIGKKISCVRVMDTTGEQHQFCNHERSEVKCQPSLGYQL